MQVWMCTNVCSWMGLMCIHVWSYVRHVYGHVPAIYEPFPRSQYVMSAALALWICWMLPPWEDLASLGRTGCYLGRYMVL